jgi:hypothetical protein
MIEKPTPNWKVALAWLIVILPAAWGIAQTVRKSLPLFHTPPPASSLRK